jgi:putative ABC transport system permease protein
VLSSGTQERELVNLTRASASLLPVLGVSPVLGRNLTALEDAVGGAPVTMLSYESRQSRFAGDAAVIGRVVHFNDQSYTIIGVLPPGLSLTRSNTTGIDPPFWIPVGQDSIDSREPTNHSYRAVARLKPGVTLKEAVLETERILRGDRRPERRGVRLEGFHADQTRDVRKPLLLLLAAVGLLLLMARVNVAILLLGEATAREGEIASRVALGAGRGRVMRQLVTESLVLAFMGAALGSALAWEMTRVLVALAPSRIPGLADVQMDVRVLGFALGAATVTGILFGLAPALTLLRSSPAQILRASARQSIAGRGQLQRAFIAIELALSLVLLVGAALVAGSFARLTAVNIGFRPENLLVVRTFVPASIGRDTARSREFHRAAVERLSAIPGVVAATATSNAPFGGSSSTSLEIEGQVYDSAAPRPEAQQRTTVPGFFRAMGIPLIAGRVYDERDRSGGPPVIVLSQETARRYWPNESPIGKRVRYQGEWREVIGIVGDIKFLASSELSRSRVRDPHRARRERAKCHRARYAVHAHRGGRWRRRGTGRCTGRGALPGPVPLRRQSHRRAVVCECRAAPRRGQRGREHRTGAPRRARGAGQRAARRIEESR